MNTETVSTELSSDEWRDVPDSNGKYRISNRGVVVDNRSNKPVKVNKHSHVGLCYGNGKRWWRPDILARIVFGDDAVIPPRPPIVIKMRSAIKPHVADLPKHFDFEEDREERARMGKDWLAIRRYVLDRDGHCCQMCKTDEYLEVHHIRPRSTGGGDNEENLIVLCRKCHDIAELNDLKSAQIIRNWIV